MTKPEWPDIAALELLVAVADHGSLSAAARAIGAAQPNASRSLARLERRLGIALVTRSTTGSTLTPPGLLVVEWARSVLAATETLLDGAGALVATGPATLTVSASQTVAEHLLPQWLAALRDRHPETSAAVRVKNTSDVIADVLHGTCAVGFVEGPRPPRGVHTTVVAEDELVLVVHPGHRWAERTTPVTTDELATTPLLTREPGSGTRVTLDRALGTPAVSAQELASNAAVRVGVVAGGPPAVLSQLAVEDALARGQLLRVPLAGLDLRRELRAVWAGPRRLPGVPGELVDVARGR